MPDAPQEPTAICCRPCTWPGVCLHHMADSGAWCWCHVSLGDAEHAVGLAGRSCCSACGFSLPRTATGRDTDMALCLLEM